MEAIVYKCPNCGANVSKEHRNCDYCESPVTIKSFKEVREMPLPLVNKYIRSYTDQIGIDGKPLAFSLGMCQLKLKLYDKAFASFEKAMDDEMGNADAYFYAVVALLKGGKAFLLLRDDADKAVEYLNAACSIDDTKSIYWWLHGYIKEDFFERKFLRAEPKSQACYQTAFEMATEDEDAITTVTFLFDLLGVEFPKALKSFFEIN